MVVTVPHDDSIVDHTADVRVLSSPTSALRCRSHIDSVDEIQTILFISLATFSITAVNGLT